MKTKKNGSRSVATMFRQMLAQHLKTADARRGQTRLLVLALIYEAHPNEAAQNDMKVHGLSGPSVSEALTELEDLRLIKVRRNPQNHREQFARLTAKGERELRALEALA